MGENLSIAGMLETEVWIGDTLHFPDCSLRVTAPREPCFKFAAIMGFAQAGKRMMQQGCPGFYLSVVAEPATSRRAHLHAGAWPARPDGERRVSRQAHQASALTAPTEPTGFALMLWCPLKLLQPPRTGDNGDDPIPATFRDTHPMSTERVLFAFVIVLALTLNVGFIAGDINDINHHNVYELFAALVVSLIATVMKFGDRSPLGSSMLATSLVADLQLIAAATAWGFYAAGGADLTAHQGATVVSLSIGAAVANVVSVVLLIIEMANLRR